MERLLKPREVAEMLGVSLSTVERLINSGAFPDGLVRFRGNTRITPAALEDFVLRHTETEPDWTGKKSLRGPTVKNQKLPTFGEMTNDDSPTPASRRRLLKPERTIADALNSPQKASQ
jgi:excisionase family DNA binding protein